MKRKTDSGILALRAGIVAASERAKQMKKLGNRTVRRVVTPRPTVPPLIAPPRKKAAP